MSPREIAVRFVIWILQTVRGRFSLVDISGSLHMIIPRHSRYDFCLILLAILLPIISGLRVVAEFTKIVHSLHSNRITLHQPSPEPMLPFLLFSSVLYRGARTLSKWFRAWSSFKAASSASEMSPTICYQKIQGCSRWMAKFTKGVMHYFCMIWLSRLASGGIET